MKMLGGLPLLAAVCAVHANAIKPAAVIPHPAGITAAPYKQGEGPLKALARRQDSSSVVTSAKSGGAEDRPDFIGWYMTTTYQGQFCDKGSTWTTSASFGHCCATNEAGGCTYVTECADQSRMVDDQGETATCPNGFGCGRVTVYDAFPNSSPHYNFLCANNLWSAWTMYRHVSLTETSAAPSSTSSSPTTPTDPTAASQTTRSSDTASPEKPIEAPSSSNAWIAGAVIGPIAGIAIIGAIAFLVWRRNNRHREGVAAPGANNYEMHEDQEDFMPYNKQQQYPTEYYNPGAQQPTGYEGAAAYQQPVEVPSHSAPQELGSQEVHRK